jgi:glucose/arabinose dehydrogenase
MLIVRNQVSSRFSQVPAVLFGFLAVVMFANVVVPASAQTGGLGPTGVPAWVGADVVGTSSLRIRWTDTSSNETGYLLYRVAGATAALVPGCPSSTPNVTSCVDTGLTPGTPYTYYVYAWNSNGTTTPGTYLLTRTVSVTPAAPEILSAIPTGPNSVSLRWADRATNETGYQIKRYDAGVFTPLPAALPANSTTGSYTNLSMSTSSVQVFVVSALNSFGETLSDTYVYSLPLGPATTTVNPPTSISTGTVSGTSVEVSWTDTATNELGYVVYRYLNGVTTLVNCPNSTPNLSSCVDSSVTPNSYPIYYVYSWNAAGIGYGGAPLVVHTPQPLAAPILTSAYGSSASSITVNWIDNSSDETGFTVYEYAAGSYTPVATVGANTSTATIAGLNADSFHVYVVAAIRAGGTTTQTYAPAAVWANAQPPCAPRTGNSIAVEPVASGLVQPVGITGPPGDSRLFVVEQTGKVRIIKNGVLLPTPLIDVTTRIVSGGERGLLGIAFHPQFVTNGRFYLNYTRAADGATVIEEFAATSGTDVASPATGRVILTIAQPFSNHNAGWLEFGIDNKLYIAMGDGGGAGDPTDQAQDDRSLLGKVLRIDVDTRTGNKQYGIPSDNPFAGSADSSQDARPEIWQKGLRNPYRFSFDRATGDIYIGDVGQSAYEELDYSPNRSGINWGWDDREGAHCFEPLRDCLAEGRTDPVVEHTPAQGWRSIIGGQVYRGSCFPSLVGEYFYSDFYNGEIWALKIAGGVATNDRAVTASLGSVSHVHAASNGEIYITSYDGQVRRLVVQ